VGNLGNLAIVVMVKAQAKGCVGTPRAGARSSVQNKANLEGPRNLSVAQEKGYTMAGRFSAVQNKAK
jgi:hypothetical protein